MPFFHGGQIPPIPAGGVPTPPAVGNFDLISRAGVLKYRQRENLKVTFAASASQAAVWNTFGANAFTIVYGVRVTDAFFVTIRLTNVTASGCTVDASAAFTGEVDLECAQII